MAYIFVILFLISLVLLPIVLIKPSVIFRKRNVSRKKAGGIVGGATMLFLILTGMTAPPTEIKSTSIKATNTPPVEAETNIAQESITPATLSHGGVMVKVVNVVDGDTIKIETGETVRYIGIDTPETVSPSKPVMCYGKEASDKNTELVEGKVVELEKDVSETDKYGRLLRYIWLEGVLINELLVREGYAQSSTYPPDVKYQERFIEAQRLARLEQKGLWSSACAISPSSIPVVSPTKTPYVTPKPTFTTAPKPTVKPTQNTTQSTTGGTNSGNNTQSGSGGGTYSCNCSKTCPQMSSCQEAQYQLNVCGCSQRDADDDGIACDSDCQ